MKLRSLLWLFPLLFLGLFYLYPLAAIMQASFARAGAGSAAAILDGLTSEATRKVILFTFRQASLSTLLTLAVGVPGAYVLARYDFPGKTLFRALTGIPFVLPTLVAAAAFDSLLGGRGWLNHALMLLFGLNSPPITFSQTFGAILIAHVFYNTTIVLRVVGDFWASLDSRLVDAARTLGANRLQAALRVTAPLLSPALAAAALLVFLFDFTSFGVILVLGGPKFATLETEIYYQTSVLFDLPYAATLAFVQIFFTLILTLAYSRLAARLSMPLRRRSDPDALRKPSGLRRRALAAFILGGLVLLLILPLFSLTLRSFLRLGGERGQLSAVERGLTLDHYRQLSETSRQSSIEGTPLDAVGVSLSYALSVVGLSLLLGLPTAWLLSQRAAAGRWAQRGAAIFDAFMMLPLGTSAVTLGLGFVIAFNRPPLLLGSSPLLIPLAHTLVAFPFVVRSLTPALHSIQPRLRQAAAVAGASPVRVFWFIDFPLIARAVVAAAAFAFTISIGEFGATALLSRPEFPTVPVVIYRFLGRPGGSYYGQALALSVVLMLICALSMVLIEKVRLGETREF